MYNNDGTEITLFSLLLFCVLTIIIAITIIDYSYYYHHPDNQQYSTLLYIQAQPDISGINNKEDKKEKKDDEKKNEKELEKKDKQEKKGEEEYDNNNSWTRSDKDLITKYNYRNLAIPQVYQTTPAGEIYKFKHNNPNGQVQVDESENKNVFTKQNRDGSWRIEYGKPRIDIHTKDAGILPDKLDQLNNMSNGNKIQSWNFSELKEIGYWYKPSDWKNVEVTLIFKLLDSSRSKG